MSIYNYTVTELLFVHYAFNVKGNKIVLSLVKLNGYIYNAVTVVLALFMIKRNVSAF